MLSHRERERAEAEHRDLEKQELAEAKYAADLGEPGQAPHPLSVHREREGQAVTVRTQSLGQPKGESKDPYAPEPSLHRPDVPDAISQELQQMNEELCRQQEELREAVPGREAMLKAKADALSLAIAAKKTLHVEAQLKEFKGMAPRTIRHHRARLYKLLQQDAAQDGAPREAPPQQQQGEDSLELLNQQGYVVQQRLNRHRGRGHKADKAEAATIAE